jgi:hypothetical protein
MRIIALFFIKISMLMGLKYGPCNHNQRVKKNETRILYVANCDTKTEWSQVLATKIWNVSGIPLRRDGVVMTNVCSGSTINWSLYGPLFRLGLFLKYITNLKKILNVKSRAKAYVMVMDCDAIWSVDNVAKVWERFDCARGGSMWSSKEIVMSTSTSCWAGRHCNKDDLTRWYKGLERTPSFSPFIYPSLFMGSIEKVEKMLYHILTHNSTYKVNNNPFDIYAATTDYAVRIAPVDVALDYHQQLFAGFAVHFSGALSNRIGPGVVCKKKNGKIDRHCPDMTGTLKKQGHYAVEESSCHIKRKVLPNMLSRGELQTLAPDPVLFHGTGGNL